MIDHTGISVADVARSKAFYRAALAPLGYELLLEWEKFAGFGVAPKPDFWIGEGAPNVPPIHVAFRAETRAQVDAFHEAAMAAGGRDMARRACGRTTTRITTARSCSIPTGTTSKPCAIRRFETGRCWRRSRPAGSAATCRPRRR